MSDPIESAIAAEHDRQERAWQHAHACMDFCGDFNIDGCSLEEVVRVLKYGHDILEVMSARSLGMDKFIEESGALLTKLKPESGDG